MHVRTLFLCERNHYSSIHVYFRPTKLYEECCTRIGLLGLSRLLTLIHRDLEDDYERGTMG